MISKIKSKRPHINLTNDTLNENKNQKPLTLNFFQKRRKSTNREMTPRKTVMETTANHSLYLGEYAIGCKNVK
jgi:hypothetical protein